VALGPYHHLREELGDMERYKLSAAKRAQIHLPSSDFQQLVDAFTKLEHLIRAHYHRSVSYSFFGGQSHTRNLLLRLSKQCVVLL
jgi:hypothetical protein